MQVLLKELKYNLRPLITWGLTIFVLIAVGGLVFRFLLRDNTEITDLFYIVPKMLALLVGMPLEADLSTAGGTLSVLMLYPTYLLMFHAGFLGVHIIAREKQTRTQEFLYSRPMPRYLVLLLKIAAALIICLALTLMTHFALRLFFGKAAIAAFAGTYLRTNLLLQLVFLGLGTAIATLTRHPYHASHYTGWLMVLLLLLAKALEMLQSGSALWLLTPFRYFVPQFYLLGGGISGLAYVLSLLWVVVTFAVTFLLTQTRDVRAGH